jgi:hypothetical protein
MRDLNDMRLGERAAITFAIVLTILAALALFGYLTGGWNVEAATEPPPRATSKYDDHIDALERQALDDAFKKYIGQLYNIWVTDNYQPKIPPRATTGARNARDAYVRSMDAIEARAQPPRH